MGYKTLQPNLKETTTKQQTGFYREFKVVAKRRRGLMKICLLYDRFNKRKYFLLHKLLLNRGGSPFFRAPTIWID